MSEKITKSRIAGVMNRYQSAYKKLESARTAHKQLVSTYYNTNSEGINNDVKKSLGVLIAKQSEYINSLDEDVKCLSERTSKMLATYREQPKRKNK